MPFASVQRESIAELLDHFHGDNGRCAEVPGLRPKTLNNLRSEYNHCSGVVPLSAV
jgi:DNA-binding NtrC family response regulator